MGQCVTCHAADTPAKLECYISLIRGAAADFRWHTHSSCVSNAP